MGDSELTVSVIVISWNQFDFLRRLVEQLLAQEYDPADYEIVVVDDGSTDGSQEWLRSKSDSRLRALISDRRCGRSESRNHGILEARGRIIVMLDGDHTVRPDFLSVHARRHQEKTCAIVGKSDFVDHPHFRALNHYLNFGGAMKLPSEAPLPGRYFLTRNCSVPKKVLLEIGLFDESFRQWGGEDLDLGARIENAGVPIYGEPKALAIHHHLRTLPELLDTLHLYGKSGIPLVVEKHPRMFRELNLDRVFHNPFEPDRFSDFSRCVARFLMTPAVYSLVKRLAILFRRRRLPRIVFDYLHLRQYARGYSDYLRTRSDSNANLD